MAEAAEQALYNVPPTVTTADAFAAHSALYAQQVELLHDHYSEREDMRLHLRRFIRRQRAQESAVNLFRPQALAAPPVLAFGSGYFGCRCKRGDRNGAPVMKSIRRRLTQMYRVVLVDEYLTSQMCSRGCGTRMDINDATCMARCPTPACGHAEDRDINAAKNILRVFRSRPNRPLDLARP